MLTFRVPPFYSLIVRTLTILEGLALFVDPDFRLIKVLEGGIVVHGISIADRVIRRPWKDVRAT